jgi:hypothetical protein
MAFDSSFSEIDCFLGIVHSLADPMLISSDCQVVLINVTSLKT